MKEAFEVWDGNLIVDFDFRTTDILSPCLDWPGNLAPSELDDEVEYSCNTFMVAKY